MSIEDKILNIIENYSDTSKIVIYNVKQKDYNDFLKKYYENNGYTTEWLNNKKDNYNKKTILFTTKSYNDLNDYKQDFFLLDYSRINTTNHYIFCVNYEGFDFGKFYKEAKDNDIYKGVLWENKKRYHINLGDTIYLYFTNLPDKLSRIMAKGTVIDDGFHYGLNNVCGCTQPDINDEYKIELQVENEITKDTVLGLRIDFKNNIFDDSDAYSLSKVCLGDKLTFSNYQSVQKIDDEEFINYIEENINKCMKDENRNTFSYYRDNFNNVKCFFEEHKKEASLIGLDFMYSHKSFINEKGIMYYEIHHVIEQNNFRNGHVDGSIIYSNNNEIPLCLNCHSRIHNGLIEDRKKMVNLIYRYSKVKDLLDKIPDKFFKDIKVNNKRYYWLLSQYVKEDCIKEKDII